MPNIFIGADHAGYRLKEALKEHLATRGYEVEDVGAPALDPADDYPDYAMPLARQVAGNAGSFGIFLGGSGEGEAMCINRVPGARAAVFYGMMRVTDMLEIEGGKSKDGFDIIRLARRHNDANVLSIGARFVSAEEADEAVRIFLDTPFSNDPRHVRRLAKF